MLVRAEQIDIQPEFPEKDLTDRNADRLSLTLQDSQTVEQNHMTGEGFLVYRSLHPILDEYMASAKYEGASIDAGSYGMTLFEAINSSVHAVAASGVKKPELLVVVGRIPVAQSLANTVVTQEVIDAFEERLPNTVRVVREAAARPFPGHVQHALAGAALECMITRQSLRIGRQGLDTEKL